MKILIITALFFPSLSPRAQRSTELAKEFAKRENEVIVYALLGRFPYNDFTNTTNVIVKNLGESNWGYPNSEGQIKDTVLTRAIKKVVGNTLWLPDREMIPMVKKAIKSEGEIDLLLTIAIPHVLNYAASLCDLTKVKNWVSDCGDPFSNNPYTVGLYPKYLEKYEKKWCSRCPHIVVPVEEAKDAYFPEFREKIAVIPQGYDFSQIVLPEYTANTKITFAYAGALYPGLRDPSKFLEYLSNLDVDFEFWLFGTSWKFVAAFKDGALNKRIINGGTLTRDKLIPKLATMDFLINVKNNSSVQQPSKLIDYALAKRPVLSISSDFWAEEQTNFQNFTRGDFSCSENLPNLNQFDIRNVVDQFLALK